MRNIKICVGIILLCVIFSFEIIYAQEELTCEMDDDLSRGMCGYGFEIDPPDYPFQRDLHLPNESTEIKTINLFVHAFSFEDGSSPTTTLEIFEERISDLNQTFDQLLTGTSVPYKIQFNAVFEVHNNPRYLSLYPKGINNLLWQQAVEEYAVDPMHVHNVYITNLQNNLGGRSTMPFSLNNDPNDPVSPAPYSIYNSTWVTSLAFNTYTEKKIFEHEIGHALGLLHTFNNNYLPLDCSDPCRELPGLPSALECSSYSEGECDDVWGCSYFNYVIAENNCTQFDNEANCENEAGCSWNVDDSFCGVRYNYCGSLGDQTSDLCQDTPATFLYSYCDFPTEQFCDEDYSGEGWGPDYENLMSYNFDCRNYFTNQQVSRMHAWIDYALSGNNGGANWLFHPEQSNLVVQNIDPGNQDAGGFIFLDRFDTPDIIDYSLPSNQNPVTIDAGYLYSALTQLDESSILSHLNWNDNNDNYRIEKDLFILPTFLDDFYTRNDLKYEIIFGLKDSDGNQLSPIIGNLEIRDPWFVEIMDGVEVQLNQFREIESNTHNIFLNQGGDIMNLSGAFYSLNAPETHMIDGQFYQFSYWESEIPTDAEWVNYESFQTDVKFTTPNALINAVYIIEDIPISVNQILPISLGIMSTDNSQTVTVTNNSISNANVFIGPNYLDETMSFNGEDNIININGEIVPTNTTVFTIEFLIENGTIDQTWPDARVFNKFLDTRYISLYIDTSEEYHLHIGSSDLDFLQKTGHSKKSCCFFV